MKCPDDYMLYLDPYISENRHFAAENRLTWECWNIIYP